MFSAVLPPLSNILATDNPNVQSRLNALRGLGFLTVRPTGVDAITVGANLGRVVESLLVPPIVLSLFSVRLVSMLQYLFHLL